MNFFSHRAREIYALRRQSGNRENTDFFVTGPVTSPIKE